MESKYTHSNSELPRGSRHIVDLRKSALPVTKKNNAFITKLRSFSLKKQLKKIALPKIAFPRFTAPQIRLSRISFAPVVKYLMHFFRGFKGLLSYAKKAQEFESPSSFSETLSSASFKSDFQRPVTSNFRLALSFFVLLFILILPFKGFSYFESFDDLRVKVLDNSKSAVAELFKAGSSAGNMNFSGATTNFTEASKNFASAQDNLSQINDLVFSLAKLLPNDKARLAGNSKLILEAGKIVSDLGQAITITVDGMIGDKDRGLDIVLANLATNGRRTVALSVQLESVLNSIEVNDLPPEFRSKFTDLQTRSGVFKNSLIELMEMADMLALLTGKDMDTRYLLVFQNNSEMRASGGFFGSYALLDFSKGKIKKIEVPAGGTYDVEAGYRERIIAPTPLQMVNPLWHMWDANWWYDWPTSAKKLAWFYEKSSGPTVDGVISFTPTVIEDILRAYGPVDMTKDYGVTITADNFWEVTQTFSEQKQHVTLKPKKIIGDLFSKIVTEMPSRLNKQMLLSMYSVAEKSLNEKQAMFYFKNETLNDFARTYGWDGRVKETTQDYLAVINSSVAGGKSDREISQDIIHKATILADGSVIDEVQIVRRHAAIRGSTFVGQRNVDWMRVYVPAGSELIEASGFNAPDAKFFQAPDPSWQFDEDLYAEDMNFQRDPISGTKIYQELGKTVFANWSMIDPGETRVVYFKYRLPFKVTKLIKPEVNEKIAKLLNINDKQIVSYGLLTQKQPGSLRVTISSALNTEPYQRALKSDVIWTYPRSINSEITGTGWQISKDFNLDQYYAIILSQK